MNNLELSGSRSICIFQEDYTQIMHKGEPDDWKDWIRPKPVDRQLERWKLEQPTPVLIVSVTSDIKVGRRRVVQGGWIRKIRVFLTVLYSKPDRPTSDPYEQLRQWQRALALQAQAEEEKHSVARNGVPTIQAMQAGPDGKKHPVWLMAGAFIAQPGGKLHPQDTIPAPAPLLGPAAQLEQYGELFQIQKG